ncbi:MAG: hypothetical protein JXA54_14445 [Candidatus Heimdallarchaeota archaeon]|nr:hypothetical protein [Candidatus Heimdallarchaeota archaeon]
MMQLEKEILFEENLFKLNLKMNGISLNQKNDLKNNILVSLLSDDTISLDTKVNLALIAPLFGITAQKDYMLLLMAFEIAKYYNAKIIDGGDTFLIFKDDYWCLLLSHGTNFIEQRKIELVDLISKTFKVCILGFCYSENYVHAKNMVGFSSKITLFHIIQVLGTIMEKNTKLNLLNNLQIKEYKLGVTADVFNVNHLIVLGGLFELWLANKPNHNSLPLSNVVTLTPEIARHISFSCSALTNDDIRNTLTLHVDLDSVDYFRHLYLVKQENGDYHLVVLRTTISLDSKDKYCIYWVVIGPHFNRDEFTIMTAGCSVKREDFLKLVVTTSLLSKFKDIWKEKYPDSQELIPINIQLTNCLGLSNAPDLISDFISTDPAGGYIEREKEGLGEKILNFLDRSADWILEYVINPILENINIIFVIFIIMALFEFLCSLGIEEATHFNFPVTILCFSLAALLITTFCTSTLSHYQFTINTSPLVTDDSDSDGIPDSIEEYYFNFYPEFSSGYTNQFTWLDSDFDYDTDGLSTLFETRTEIGFDPFQIDSDFDGINDLVEVELIDPNNADFDGDGIPDCIERSYFNVVIVGSPDEAMLTGEEDTWLDANIDYDGDSILTGIEIRIGSDPFIIDTDKDGLNDNQEVEINSDIFNFNSNPCMKDTDLDGLSDLSEETLGLNPLDMDQDCDSLLDGWEYYANRIGWDNGETKVSEDYANPYNPCPSEWVNNDDDSDDLTNSDESFLFTNLYSADSDFDGIGDDIEVRIGFDPTNQVDGELDFDGDGLATNIEFAIGTFYNIPDSDGDGLLDGEEVNYYHSNPLSTDSDGDNIDDFEETVEGADGYITNPANADTDFDGIDDYEEIVNGTDGFITNPTNGDTDGDYLPDNWEIQHGYSPVSQDTNGDGTLDLNEDVDGDGLTVFEEMTYGTSDTSDDTDNDCIPDDEEIHIYETDPLDADTDDDGMSEYWEITHGLDPLVQDSTADPDMDGVNNYIESVLGLNPFNADSDGDSMPDGWEIYYGFDPTVADSSDDFDDDGLTNGDEYIYGTDPQNDDSDSDGMPDGWEVTHSLNPNTNDTTGDPDLDGLSNIDEYLKNCDPQDTDSDNDGWTDGFEVNTSGTNPIKTDTDSDGKSDKSEYLYWKSRGKSDATAYSYCKIADVDNDGLKDGVEINWGLDPLDNDMDNDGLLDGLEVNTYDTDPEDPDSDDDGYTDLYEIINGTDPNDPTDYPGGGGFNW